MFGMTGSEGGIVFSYTKILKLIEDTPYRLDIEEVETQYAPPPAVPGYGPSMPNEIKTYTFVIFHGENVVLKSMSLQEISGFVNGVKSGLDWLKQKERTKNAET